jgi:glycosyltransferase involved in cell wall biosynthesis
MKSKEFSNHHVFTLDSTISNIRNNTWTQRILRFLKRWVKFLKLFTLSRPETALIFCGHGLSFMEKGLYSILLHLSGVQVILAPQSGLILKNFPNLLFSYYARFVFRCTSKIIAQGKYWSEFYSHYASPDKIQLVYNWLSPPKSLTPPKKSSNTFKLLYLGWLEPYKGLEELLNAVLRISKYRQDFLLDIYGSGSMDSWIKDFIEKNKLEHLVSLKGWADHQDKYDILARADLLVLPSHYEGMPNVILEAHQVSTPVLSTRISSIPELVIHEEFLCEPKDSESLENKLSHLISNDYLLGNEIDALKYRKNRHDVEAAARKILHEKPAANAIPQIVFLSDWFDPAFQAGGPIRSAVALTESLKNHFRFSVLTYNKDLDGSPLDVPVNIPVIKSFGSVFYATGVYRWLVQYAFEVRNTLPAAIHINSVFSYKTSLLGYVFPWKNSNKILSTRGMLMNQALHFKSRKKKVFLGLLNRLRIPEYMKFHYSDEKEQVEKPTTIRPKKEHIISNLSGIKSRFSPNTKERNSLKILCLGRLHRIKNYHKIPEYLKTIQMPIQVKIAGPLEHLELKRDMQKAVEHLPQHRLEFLGHVGRDSLDQVFDWADVLLAPSESENFGHAIVESLLQGIPVLTSFGTPWNDLHPNKAGVNIDPSDYAAFSEALSTFAAMDAVQFDKYKKGAMSYMKERLQEERNKEKYVELYLN